jgi:hypothetical protein
MDKEHAYQSLVDAIHLAVDSEQPEGGPHPYKDETERRLHVVYVLLREALGITEDRAA